MRQWLISGLLVVALLSIGITLLAQDDSFEPSPHIYRVKAAGCTSAPEQRVQSGFRVTGQVGIFTALHGVLNCKTVIAEPSGDGRTFHDLSIGKVDIDHDVAVLWSRGLADEPMEGLTIITETLQIDQKASYQVIGYPLNVFRQKPTVDVKILERTELGNLLTNDAILILEERMSPALDAKVLSIQTHLVPGHSGAPLLNQANQVVAIGNGGLDAGRIEMGWAIPWDELDLSTIAVGVSQEVSWSERRRLREIGDSNSGYIFSYSIPEQPTATLTALVSSTVEAAIDLRVVDEGLANQHTYYIEGKNISSFMVGDDLIVYAEPNPGIEIAVALLKVVSKSSTSLIAQAILVDPRYEIRTRMRVDNNLGHLSESQLIPVFEYVDGYLLRPTRIRLRPDHGLAVGTQLQALAYERIGGAIVDALPMEPPVQMQITSLGLDGQIAGVELLTGEWPVTGTVVSLVEVPTPTSLPTATTITESTPPPTITPQSTATEVPTLTYPCEAIIYSESGSTKLNIVLRKNPGLSDGAYTRQFSSETTVYVYDDYGNIDKWYLIYDTTNTRIDWISSKYLSSACLK